MSPHSQEQQTEATSAAAAETQEAAERVQIEPSESNRLVAGVLRVKVHGQCRVQFGVSKWSWPQQKLHFFLQGLFECFIFSFTVMFQKLIYLLIVYFKFYLNKTEASYMLLHFCFIKLFIWLR